ncbi:MAG: GerW family sporulation protein, partial [Oscillospiraceae bacterium]|nr:GerW family sporulation protein [Oscillospiraceae bacterium]
KNKPSNADSSFGGGSGAGVNITPIAFLVIRDGSVRLINVSPSEHTAIDNFIDMVPEVVDKITGAMGRKKEAKEAQTPSDGENTQE